MNNAISYIDNNGYAVTNMNGFKVVSDVSDKKDQPTPGNYMVGALLNCAMGTVLAFLQKRALPTQGLQIAFDGHFDDRSMKYDDITYHVTLPEDFPEKYVNAVKRVVGTCAISKAMP
ncbi:MAG: OsmC family protein, partial [Clostridiales bacterium]|nr:OsmC family protein [Clostridiales bacterium]